MSSIVRISWEPAPGTAVVRNKSHQLLAVIYSARAGDLPISIRAEHESGASASGRALIRFRDIPAS